MVFEPLKDEVVEKGSWLTESSNYWGNRRTALGSLFVLALAAGVLVSPGGGRNMEAEIVAEGNSIAVGQFLESRGIDASSRSIGGRSALVDVEALSVEYRDPNLPATTLSANGIELIKTFEGFSNTGYLLGDGMCTIGWGHTVPAHEMPDCEEWEITAEEAHEFIADHVTYFEDAVNSFFTRDFNQNQFDALVSFAYNVGEPWYKWDWPTDPDDQFFEDVLPLYVYPAQFTEGLAKRRAAEVELFNTPVGEFVEFSYTDAG